MYRMKPTFFRILSPLLLLGFPALAMCWTDQVSWSRFDFFVMGALLLVGSLAIRLIRLYVPQQRKRIYILLVMLVLLLLWIEMGVGVFGSPIAGD